MLAQEDKKERGNTRSRSYCITINNFDIKDVDTLKSMDAEVCFQIETGEEKKTPHIQGCIKYKNPRSFKQVKLDFGTAHIEVCKNWRASVAYCSKEETRTGEHYMNFVLEEERKDDVIKDVLNENTAYEWQQDVINYCLTPRDDRKVMWVWEEKGCRGKSALARHLCITRKCIAVGGSSRDIFHAVSEYIKPKKGKNRDLEVLIIDIPRNQNNKVSYNAIESIKNGMIFSGKYESGSLIFNPPHVIVFANFEPDTNKLSEDRWLIRNLIY